MNEKLKVKIINRSANPLPLYESEAAACLDLRASLEQDVMLASLQRMLIPTGLFIELPLGYEAQIRPRSGLALKHGLTVLNSPGTIDSDYRGEIKVLLVNLSNEPFKIASGDRIAQMIIAKHEQALWSEVDYLTETVRGTGGYGHTGHK